MITYPKMNCQYHVGVACVKLSIDLFTRWILILKNSSKTFPKKIQPFAALLKNAFVILEMCRVTLLSSPRHVLTSGQETLKMLSWVLLHWYFLAKCAMLDTKLAPPPTFFNADRVIAFVTGAVSPRPELFCRGRRTGHQTHSWRASWGRHVEKEGV